MKQYDNPQFLNFIKDNINEDPERLRLKYHGVNVAIDYASAITQIDCRRRYAKKFHDTLARFEAFAFPSTLSGEQSTSDAIANVHARIIGHDVKTLTDLTAGLGIDVIHLASNATEVTAIERNPDTAEALEYNIQGLGINNIKVICGDSAELLKAGKLSGEVAFIDPARRAADGSRVFALTDCTPDLIELMPYLRMHFRRLVAKLSPMLDITRTIADLGAGVRTIYIIGTRSECKELVVDMDLTVDRSSTDDINISVYTVSETATAIFDTSIGTERSAPITPTGKPQVGNYIYEPWPTILKAGVMKIFAQRYGLKKLHNNTHVFFSDSIIEDIPADGRRLLADIPWQSKNIKRLKNTYPGLDIAVRNFGMSAEALRAKLGVKYSDSNRLLAVTDAANVRHMLILAPKEDIAK